uniref:Kinesin motor protein-like n=1 Tax=Oryza sativa subsp. japonica TaxID=39947 RepID=Q6H831_ORYSJ|nr:kinesin motor protein-like [Oryza sativa Japonica Group]
MFVKGFLGNERLGWSNWSTRFGSEQVLDRQADQLRSVSQKYENANKLWAAAISNLENKIKVMKQEQTLLSLEAHGHANAVPELSKMVGAVQALVVQCEDLKLKYYEEMPKRKKLHNIVEETKGAGLQGAVVLSNSMNMGCSHGLPVLARASAGTAGLAAARGAGAVGRAQLSLLPRDDHDCCSHSGAHDLQGSECELTTWSATKQVEVCHLVHFVIGSSSTPSCADPAHGKHRFAENFSKGALEE